MNAAGSPGVFGSNKYPKDDSFDPFCAFFAVAEAPEAARGCRFGQDSARRERAASNMGRASAFCFTCEKQVKLCNFIQKKAG